MDLKNVPNLGRTVNGRPLVIDESKNEGIQGTILCSNLLTPPIQELYNAIVMSGMSPSSDNTQLYQLLKRSQDSINTLQAEEAQLQNNINQLQNFINNELKQRFADLSKAIHDGNEELANTLSGLIGHIITVEGASSVQINNEVAARQQADSAIYQTIQNLTNQLNQETATRRETSDNLAKAIHDGNEEIALSLRDLINRAIVVTGNTFQPQDFLGEGQTPDDLINGRVDVGPIINKMIASGIRGIHLPSGTYKLDSTVNLATNTQISGEGASTIISLTMPTGDGISGRGVSTTKIQDMMISADTARSSGAAIALYGSFENSIRDIYFTNGMGRHYNNIYLEGSNSAHIDHVSGRGGSGSGITVSGTDKRSEDTYISNSGFDGYDGSPIELIWASGIYLSRLDLLGGKVAGICIAPPQSAEVDGLRATSVLADSNYGPGWYFTGEGAITETCLTNCWGSTNGIGGEIAAGLTVTNSKLNNLVINSSEFHANTETGIDIQEGQNIQISNNTVFMNSRLNSGKYPGISIGADVNNVVVTGNISGAGGEAQNGASKSPQSWGILSALMSNDTTKQAIFSGNMGTGNQNGAISIATSPTIISTNNIGQ